MNVIRVAKTLLWVGIVLFITPVYAAAQKINTSYISTTPGSSSVISSLSYASLTLNV